MAKISKSEHKLAMRRQAPRKVNKAQFDGLVKKGYREAVEKGRNELMRAAAEGGDSKAKKVKNELEYLLNNYLPKYDMRIEQLINEWRRSGDPSYDPNIRTRVRTARRSICDTGHQISASSKRSGSKGV